MSEIDPEALAERLQDDESYLLAIRHEDVLEAYDAELVDVIDTHVHADHVSGDRDLVQRHDVSYYLHPADTLDVKAQPAEDESVHVNGVGGVCVIHPPGHSPGDVMYSSTTEALELGSSRCVAE